MPQFLFENRIVQKGKLLLALALGLADEVQFPADGMQLDTIFVDEGFDSLDEEFLDQAVQALVNLTQGNKLVGIISHEASLRDKIDRQIVVKKGKSGGSTAEIVVRARKKRTRVILKTHACVLHLLRT